MVFNWFTLLFAISMALFYLSILIYAQTLKSIILKSVSHTSKNSPESNFASIRQKFLVFIYQCQGQGVNLKKLTQSQQNEHFNFSFSPIYLLKR